MPSCLALLAPIAKPSAVVFDARTEEGRHLVGAGGILWESWGRPPGFPIWVTVLPEHRRRGIGRLLLRQLVEIASGETDSLWAAAPLLQSCGSTAFAMQTGFETAYRHIFFKADLAPFGAKMRAIVRQLEKRGSIPAGLTITPLAQNNCEDVVVLVMKELENAPIDLPSAIRSATAGHLDARVNPNLSLVANLNGQIIGVLLVRNLQNAHSVQIVANVVKTGFKRTWLQPMLLEATTLNCLTAGFQHFEFDCGEDVRDTIGLAKRGNADLVRITCLVRQAIAAPVV